ncbi:MAG: hypothetical protein NVSMB65_09910 [Chloroflexota bacterium]
MATPRRTATPGTADPATSATSARAAVSRAETLRRSAELKERLLVAALLGFGAFGWLAAQHRVQAAAITTPSAASSRTTADGSDQGQGFFSEGDDGSQEGGFGFSTAPSPTSPVARSNVS